MQIDYTKCAIDYIPRNFQNFIMSLETQTEVQSDELES